MGDYFTMGDGPPFDEDAYLFLTGRNAETIISGGVNIYPQEVDNELIKHESCRLFDRRRTFFDKGEQVKAAAPPSEGYQLTFRLAQEILVFLQAALPGFKVFRAASMVVDVGSMMGGNRSLSGVFLGAEIATEPGARQHPATDPGHDVADGRALKVVIDRTFALKDAASAHRYIESRQAVGQVLLIP